MTPVTNPPVVLAIGIVGGRNYLFANLNRYTRPLLIGYYLTVCICSANIITMKNTSVPDQDIVLEELSPVLAFIYGSVEDAIQQTRDFFPEGKPVDSALAPNLVRYYVKEYIDHKSSADSQLSVSQFSRQALPNNGLFLHFSSYRIRILKADEGELPLPGLSRTRRRFYQQTLPNWTKVSGEAQPNPVNLVILWDVNSEYALDDLTIACPKDVGENQRSVEVHWRADIPHPASVHVNSTGSPAQDIDAGDIDDLHLTTKERLSTGTEHNVD